MKSLCEATTGEKACGMMRNIGGSRAAEREPKGCSSTPLPRSIKASRPNHAWWEDRCLLPSIISMPSYRALNA